MPFKIKVLQYVHGKINLLDFKENGKWLSATQIESLHAISIEENEKVSGKAPRLKGFAIKFDIMKFQGRFYAIQTEEEEEVEQGSEFEANSMTNEECKPNTRNLSIALDDEAGREKIIGRGTFGTVEFAQDLETGKFYALKSSTGELTEEYNKLNRFQLTIGPPINQNSFMMKLFPGIDLYELLLKIEEKKINLSPLQQVDIAINILKAVKSLHDKNWIHCDIMKGNIVIDPHTLEVNLVDYERAKELATNGEAPIQDIHEAQSIISPPTLKKRYQNYLTDKQKKDQYKEAENDPNLKKFICEGLKIFLKQKVMDAQQDHEIKQELMIQYGEDEFKKINDAVINNEEELIEQYIEDEFQKDSQDDQNNVRSPGYDKGNDIYQLGCVFQESLAEPYIKVGQGSRTRNRLDTWISELVSGQCNNIEAALNSLNAIRAKMSQNKFPLRMGVVSIQDYLLDKNTKLEGILENLKHRLSQLVKQLKADRINQVLLVDEMGEYDTDDIGQNLKLIALRKVLEEQGMIVRKDVIVQPDLNERGDYIIDDYIHQAKKTENIQIVTKLYYSDRLEPKNIKLEIDAASSTDDNNMDDDTGVSDDTAVSDSTLSDSADSKDLETKFNSVKLSNNLFSDQFMNTPKNASGFAVMPFFFKEKENEKTLKRRRKSNGQEDNLRLIFLKPPTATRNNNIKEKRQNIKNKKSREL